MIVKGETWSIQIWLQSKKFKLNLNMEYQCPSMHMIHSWFNPLHTLKQSSINFHSSLNIICNIHASHVTSVYRKLHISLTTLHNHWGLKSLNSICKLKPIKTNCATSPFHPQLCLCSHGTLICLQCLQQLHNPYIVQWTQYHYTCTKHCQVLQYNNLCTWSLLHHSASSV